MGLAPIHCTHNVQFVDFAEFAVIIFTFAFIQLEAASSNLNSNDAFILVTPGGSFLWSGQGASDAEKQGALQLCDILGVSATELPEGGESGERKYTGTQPW